MSAVTMHHFSGLAAPFVRSKGTVSGGVFTNPSITLDKYGHTLEEHKKRSVNQMGDIYQHTAQQRMAVLEEAQSSVPELTWGW